MTTITTPLPVHSNPKGRAALAIFAALVAVGVAAWAYNGSQTNNQTPVQPANAVSSNPVAAATTELTVAEEVQMIRAGGTKANVAPTELTLEQEFQAIRAGSTPAVAATTQLTVAEEVQMIRAGAGQ